MHFDLSKAFGYIKRVVKSEKKLVKDQFLSYRRTSTVDNEFNRWTETTRPTLFTLHFCPLVFKKLASEISFTTQA